MTFFFVLLLTRRWRGCAAMFGCGLLLAAATLPFVGVQSWLEWRQITKEIAHGNHIYENWIKLSRTIFSMVRRWTIDFEATKDDIEERDTLEIDIACWAVYLLVIEFTVRLIVMRGRELRVAASGPGAAFYSQCGLALLLPVHVL